MAQRKQTKVNSNADNGSCLVGCLLIFGIIFVFGIVAAFAQSSPILSCIILILIIGGFIYYKINNKKINEQRKELLADVLTYLDLNDIEDYLKPYDNTAYVKSRQALENYDDIKYFKENSNFEYVKDIVYRKEKIKQDISSFLIQNEFIERPQYQYVANQLNEYLKKIDDYKVAVVYVTAAGNNNGQKLISVSPLRIQEIEQHPEYLMTKGEYSKLLKQQEKEELEDKKHQYYDKVNAIIDFANKSKENLIVKSREKKLDELIQQLFDRTINSIQKIKQINSDEWYMLDNFITNIEDQVNSVIADDNMIRDYYNSTEFAQIKETCNSLNESRKEFNEYIEEKAQSISKLFGTRVVRNETQNEDSFNYIRAYKKSITPFTAEVSSTVFASAENNPIDYVIKYFYPNKVQYKEQIQKLKILIEELETLKEAKTIIDNYKRDYDQYIKNVPSYVLENDEDGFYQRLGLAIIEESVLNVEYKFTYTSGGGMAQRSFTIPMNEENIIELINRLESKLSLQAQTKEQRALMTTKLRAYIKQRDNFTCCQCGNSIFKEPNLLLEIDHIIPIAKGGLTTEDNLQTLCWKCNRSKGAKLV